MSVLNAMEDAELVARLPDDAGAFEELFRRHRRVVIGYAVRRCGQPADVADVVAATFLAVMESSAGYDPSRGAFRPWLIGVAHRQFLQVCRQQNRQRSISERAGARRILDDDAIARLEEQIDAARDSREVEYAMAGLPSRHHEVLWLVGHDGLSPREAAGVLDVSPGVFRMRLLRARRALREALADPPPFPELIPEVPR